MDVLELASCTLQHCWIVSTLPCLPDTFPLPLPSALCRASSGSCAAILVSHGAALAVRSPPPTQWTNVPLQLLSQSCCLPDHSTPAARAPATLYPDGPVPRCACSSRHLLLRAPPPPPASSTAAQLRQGWHLLLLVPPPPPPTGSATVHCLQQGWPRPPRTCSCRRLQREAEGGTAICRQWPRQQVSWWRRPGPCSPGVDCRGVAGPHWLSNFQG